MTSFQTNTSLGFTGRDSWTRVSVFLLVALSGAAAAAIVFSPRIGVLLAVLISTFLLVEYFLPEPWSTAVPLIVLFLVPGDAVLELSDHWMGLFASAGGCFLGLSTVVRSRFRLTRKSEYSFPAAAIVYLVFYAIHLSEGSLRGGGYWISAIGLWAWLNARFRSNPDTTRQGIQLAIVMVGCLSGVVAIAEYVGGFDPGAWIPTYITPQDMFTQQLGRRASGLSGHPLCLGILTFLGCLIPICRMALQGKSIRLAPWNVLAAALSGAGLVFSGARGSWLALVVGLGTCCIAMLKARRAAGENILRLSLLIVTLFGLVALSGVGVVIRERLVGSASAPQSIGQRIVAFQTIVESLPQLPLLGVGPGAVDDFIVRGGALLPNIENEYLIALVLGGPIAMVTLIWLCVAGVRAAYQYALGTRDTVALGLYAGLCVNLATFNLFSWPIGPPILAMVAALALLAPSSAPSGNLRPR